MTADARPGPVVESRLVTISAAYGAGGSVVGPALAQRLGVPFLQRVTTNEGLVPDCEPCAEMLTADEAIEELQDWAYTGKRLVPLKGYSDIVWERPKSRKRPREVEHPELFNQRIRSARAQIVQ